MSQSSVASVSPHDSPSLSLREKKQEPPPPGAPASPQASSSTQKQLDIRMSGKTPADSDSCLSVSPSPDPESKATRFDFSRQDEGRPSMTAALQTEKDFMDFVLSLPQIQQDAIEKSHGISVAHDEDRSNVRQELSEAKRQEPSSGVEEAGGASEGAQGGMKSTLAVGKAPGPPRTEHKSPTRVPPPTTTKIGLDHLDNLCKMMEQLGDLREKNSRLQRRVQYLEDLRSLQEMHRDLQEQLVVRQVALGLIPSPLSGSETQLEDDNEMLCRHGSEEMLQTFACSSKETKDSLQLPQAPLRRHSCLVDESGSSLPSASTLERSHAKGKKGHKSAWGKVKNMISTRRESVRKRPWQLKAEVGERDDPTEPTTSPAHSQATTTSDPEDYDMCDYESLLNELMDPMSPYPLSLDGAGPLCPGWDQGLGSSGSTLDGTGGVWMGPTPETEQNGGSVFSNNSRLLAPTSGVATSAPPLTVRRSKPQLTITVPSSEDLIVLQSTQRGSASTGDSGTSSSHSRHLRSLPQSSLEAPQDSRLPTTPPSPRRSSNWTKVKQAFLTSQPQKLQQQHLQQQHPHPHHRHTSSMQNPVTGAADGVADEGGGGGDHCWSLPASPTKKSSFTLDSDEPWEESAGAGAGPPQQYLQSSLLTTTTTTTSPSSSSVGEQEPSPQPTAQATITSPPPPSSSAPRHSQGAVGTVQKNIADLQKSLSGEFSRKLQEWEKLKSHGPGFGGGGGGGGPLSSPPPSASFYQPEDNLPYEFRKKLQEWEKMKEKEKIKGGEVGGRGQPPLQEDNKTKTHNEDDLPADFKKKLTEWEIRKALAGKSQHNVEELQKHLGEEFNRKMAEWERIKGQGGGGGGGGSCGTCGGSTTTSATSGTPTCATCKSTTVTSQVPPSHGSSSFMMPGLLHHHHHHHHQQQAPAGGVKGSSGGSSSPRLDQKFSAPKGKKSKAVKQEKTPVNKNEVVTQQKHRDKELQWLEKELLKVEREKQRLEREREKFQERKARLEKMREAMRQGPAEKKDIYIKTSTGEFRFEGISQTFTKKLYEWEEQKGIRPESSTIALLGPKYSSPPANLVFEASSVPESEGVVDKPRSPEVLRLLRSKSESSVADLVTSSPASLYSQPSCASLGRASADPEQLQADGKAASEPTLVTEESATEVPCALLVQLAEMELDEQEKTAVGVPTTLSRTSTQRLASSYAPAEITRLIDSSGSDDDIHRRRRNEDDVELQTTRLMIQETGSLRRGEGGGGEGEDPAEAPPTPRPRSRSAAPDFAQRDFHEPSPAGEDSPSSSRKKETLYNEASYCSLLQENMTLLDKLRQKEDLCRALEDQMGDIDTKMEGVADMHQKTLEKLRRQVTILQDNGEALVTPDEGDDEEGEEEREERPSRRRRRKMARRGSGAEEEDAEEAKEEKGKGSSAAEKDLEEDLQLDANRQLIEQLRARIVQLEMRGDQLMTEKEQLEATFALHKEQESEIAESLVQRIRELQDAGAEVSIQTGHCQAGQDSADDVCEAPPGKGPLQQLPSSEDPALLQQRPPNVETTDTEDPDLETKKTHGKAGRGKEATEGDVEVHLKDASRVNEVEPPEGKGGTAEGRERGSPNLRGVARPSRPSRKRKKTPPKKVQKLHSLTSDLLFQAKRMEQVLVSRNSKGAPRGGPRSPSGYKAALGAWPAGATKPGLRGHSSLRLAGEVAPGGTSSSGLGAKGRRRGAQRTWSSIEAICPDHPEEAKENSQVSTSSWEGRLGCNSFSGRSVDAVASSSSGSPSYSASPLASWDTQELLAMNVELSRMAKQLRHEMMALWTFRESTSPESDSPESDHVRATCAPASFRTPGVFHHHDQEGDKATQERDDLDRQREQQQKEQQEQAAQLMAEAREVFQNIAALQMQEEDLRAHEALEDARGASLHRGGSRRRVLGAASDGEATKRLRRDQRDGDIDDDVALKDDYKEYREAGADEEDEEGASGDSDDEDRRSAGVKVRMKILNDAQNSRIVILNEDSKEMRRRRRRKRKEGGQLLRTSPPPPPTSSSPPPPPESPEIDLPCASSPIATSQTTEDDSTILSTRSRSLSESPSLPSSVPESETTPMPESFFSFEDTDDVSLPGTWRTTTTTSTSATTRSGEHVLSSSFEWEDDEAYRLRSRAGEGLRKRSASDRLEEEDLPAHMLVENDEASVVVDALKVCVRPEVPPTVSAAPAAAGVPSAAPAATGATSAAPKRLLMEGSRTWSEVAEEERRRFETEVTAQRLRVGYLRMRRVSDTQVEYAYEVDDPQDHRFAYTFSRTVFDDEALVAGRVRRGPSFRMMVPKDKMPTSWRRSRASPGSSKQELGQDVFVPTKRTIFTVQANLTDPHETQATPTFVESLEEDVQGPSSSVQRQARREEKEDKKKKKKKDGERASPDAKQRRISRTERQKADDVGKKSSSRRRVSATASDTPSTATSSRREGDTEGKDAAEREPEIRDEEKDVVTSLPLVKPNIVTSRTAPNLSSPVQRSPRGSSSPQLSEPAPLTSKGAKSRLLQAARDSSPTVKNMIRMYNQRITESQELLTRPFRSLSPESPVPSSSWRSPVSERKFVSSISIREQREKYEAEIGKTSMTGSTTTVSSQETVPHDDGEVSGHIHKSMSASVLPPPSSFAHYLEVQRSASSNLVPKNMNERAAAAAAVRSAEPPASAPAIFERGQPQFLSKASTSASWDLLGVDSAPETSPAASPNPPDEDTSYELDTSLDKPASPLQSKQQTPEAKTPSAKVRAMRIKKAKEEFLARGLATASGGEDQRSRSSQDRVVLRSREGTMSTEDSSRESCEVDLLSVEVPSATPSPQPESHTLFQVHPQKSKENKNGKEGPETPVRRRESKRRSHTPQPRESFRRQSAGCLVEKQQEVSSPPVLKSASSGILMAKRKASKGHDSQRKGSVEPESGRAVRGLFKIFRRSKEKDRKDMPAIQRLCRQSLVVEIPEGKSGSGSKSKRRGAETSHRDQGDAQVAGDNRSSATLPRGCAASDAPAATTSRSCPSSPVAPHKSKAANLLARGRDIFKSRSPSPHKRPR